MEDSSPPGAVLTLFRPVVWAFCVYILALAIRLYGIEQPTPQPDEPLWQQRSWEMVEAVQNGRYSSISIGMAHPGVPAAAVLAVGQWLNDRLMERRSLVLGMAGYRTRLTAARMSNAIVSSLVIPILILGGSALFGAPTACTAGLLLAFDPNHIWLSRLAHIDAVLILFSVASVLLYANSILRGSLGGILFAGLLWGLAFTTKPTAMFIVPVVLLFGLFQRRRSSSDSLLRTLPWPEFWSFALGIAVFILLWQRLWHPLNQFSRHLNIGVGRIRAFDETIHWLNRHPLASWGICLLLCSVAAALFLRCRREPRHPGRHIAGLLLVSSLVPVSALLRPALPKNLVGYANWVFGLREMTHKAYGETWEPVAFGYFELFARKLPDVPLLGLACFAVAALYIILFRKNRLAPTAARPAALLLGVVLLWELVLNISPKQTFRYTMPIVPLLYLLASLGLLSAAALLRRLLPVDRRRVATTAFLIGATTTQALLWRIAPDYSLYFNRLSGGLRAALDHGVPISVDGQEAGISFLRARARREGSPVYVSSTEEFGLLNYEYKRLYGVLEDRDQSVRFYPWWPRSNGMFLLVYDHFTHLSRYHIPAKFGEPIFQYKVEGIPIYSIYEPPVPKPAQPIIFEIAEMYHATGTVLEAETATQGPLLSALPRRDKPGVLLDGDSARLPPGLYQGHFIVSAGSDRSLLPDRADTPVALLQIGDTCRRPLLAGELPKDSFSDIELDCLFDTPIQAPVRIEWLGNAPLHVKEVRIDTVEHADGFKLPS